MDRMTRTTMNRVPVLTGKLPSQGWRALLLVVSLASVFLAPAATYTAGEDSLAKFNRRVPDSTSASTSTLPEIKTGAKPGPVRTMPGPLPTLNRQLDVNAPPPALPLPNDVDGDGVTNDLDMDDDNDGIPDDIEDLGFDSRGGTIPCLQPGLNFQFPTLVGGTSLSSGAVYRFTNVTAGVDALLTIGNILNATITTLDDNSQGFTDAFQPVITFSGTGKPGIIFHFQFVNTGTNTPTNLLKRFGGTTYDVDGSTHPESFLFYSPSSGVRGKFEGIEKLKGA
jgi:hypothetical protein